MLQLHELRAGCVYASATAGVIDGLGRIALLVISGRVRKRVNSALTAVPRGDRVAEDGRQPRVRWLVIYGHVALQTIALDALSVGLAAARLRWRGQRRCASVSRLTGNHANPQHRCFPAVYPVVSGDGGGWLDHGFHIGMHSHAEGLLVYAASGILTTTTGRGTWVAPADRVTWTPPGFEHSHRFYGETDVRLITIPPELCGALAAHPSVFAVSSLLREVLLAMTDRQEMPAAAFERLRGVVIDELAEVAESPLHLPEARDDRLNAVTDLLRADPGRAVTLGELGREVGASERTLSRLFRAELGMSFHRWRTILRVHHALAGLTAGTSVTATAMQSGWSNPSSFIDAFTSIVGQTPGRYQADLRSGNR